MKTFALGFDKSEIDHWASRYSYPGESYVVDTLAPRVRAAGFYSKPNFLALCEWKSPRIRKYVAKNTDSLIRVVTQAALTTNHERFRVEVLTLLRGVSWPVASVLLHFGSTDSYPILDFRALWSLGISAPATYDYDLWAAYTHYCRQLANECGVTMRVLDRALWQYSKEHQPKPQSEADELKQQQVEAVL